jgi:hypothetical protein
MNRQAIRKPQTDGVEVPRNDVVAYTIDGNVACPRGVHRGQVISSWKEPHETEQDCSWVRVRSKVSTPSGEFTVTGKLLMKGGSCTPLMMLRSNSGESLENLLKEHRSNTEGQSTFDLKKLVGRTVTVQVVDRKFTTPEGSEREYVYVGYVAPTVIREDVIEEKAKN